MIDALSNISYLEYSIEESVSDEEKIKETLLDKYKNGKGYPILHYAIEIDDLEGVKEILQYFPEQINQKTPDRTLMIVKDDYRLVHNANGDWYLEPVPKGKHLGPVTERGMGPLLLALSQGKEEMALLLLEQGADANEKPPAVREMIGYGETNGNYTKTWPLAYAIQMNSEKLVKALLEAKADPFLNCYEKQYFSILPLEAYSSWDFSEKLGYRKITEMLLSDPNWRTELTLRIVDMHYGKDHWIPQFIRMSEK